jgi:hypothetical protein
MKTIKLTRGYETIVDDEDYDMLSKINWFSNIDGSGYVSVRSHNGGNLITMPRFIMGITDKSLCIDHINRNPLDNRKCNFRVCSYEDNKRNRKISIKNKSGYYGVNFYKRTNRWVSKICVGGKRKHLGYFDSKEDAAMAYDRECVKNRGKFAVLNFKDTV